MGEIVTLTTATGAKVTWWYATDPERNMIELQTWAARQVIRPCCPDDLERTFQIINDAAQAHRGVIPADRWKEPYMPLEELKHEIGQGVKFSGIEVGGVLVGIIGIQPVKDVTLIRQAYVATAHRSKGLGGILLSNLLQEINGPILWAPGPPPTWEIRFYEKHGFRQVTPAEKDRLLRTYWSIPERQVETSVLLANAA
jgi:GNAT superfamily N-acetyltransferase